MALTMRQKLRVCRDTIKAQDEGMTRIVAMNAELSAQNKALTEELTHLRQSFDSLNRGAAFLRNQRDALLDVTP